MPRRSRRSRSVRFAPSCSWARKAEIWGWETVEGGRPKASSFPYKKPSNDIFRMTFFFSVFAEFEKWFPDFRFLVIFKQLTSWSFNRLLLGASCLVGALWPWGFKLSLCFGLVIFVFFGFWIHCSWFVLLVRYMSSVLRISNTFTRSCSRWPVRKTNIRSPSNGDPSLYSGRLSKRLRRALQFLRPKTWKSHGGSNKRGGNSTEKMKRNKRTENVRKRNQKMLERRGEMETTQIRKAEWRYAWMIRSFFDMRRWSFRSFRILRRTFEGSVISEALSVWPDKDTSKLTGWGLEGLRGKAMHAGVLFSSSLRETVWYISIHMASNYRLELIRALKSFPTDERQQVETGLINVFASLQAMFTSGCHSLSRQAPGFQARDCLLRDWAFSYATWPLWPRRLKNPKKTHKRRQSKKHKEKTCYFDFSKRRKTFFQPPGRLWRAERELGGPWEDTFGSKDACDRGRQFAALIRLASKINRLNAAQIKRFISFYQCTISTKPLLFAMTWSGCPLLAGSLPSPCAQNDSVTWRRERHLWHGANVVQMMFDTC